MPSVQVYNAVGTLNLLEFFNHFRPFKKEKESVDKES